MSANSVCAGGAIHLPPPITNLEQRDLIQAESTLLKTDLDCLSRERLTTPVLLAPKSVIKLLVTAMHPRESQR
jgi:hypothetical protein